MTPAFTASVTGAGSERRLSVTGPHPASGAPVTREHRLRDDGHDAYAELFDALAHDFALRRPSSRRPFQPEFTAELEPLLTEPVSPDILYGYGDPCVLRTDGPDAAWYLIVTSNDAPQSFPILRSCDLQEWEMAGFAFPEGRKPAWTLDGPGAADFWAPELHRVGAEYWLCFAAREKNGALAIGMAKAPRPEGPFAAADAPILRGGVIDPHILAGPDGSAWLFWKEDRNEEWPSLLAALLQARPELIPALFPPAEDQRTAALAAALQPWTQGLPPMERFCALQVLIEAVTADFAGFRARLASSIEAAERAAIEEAMRTRVYAQALSRDGAALVGEPTLVLENDQPWEAHLIEGMWVAESGGAYYMFYSGNDFSTAQYGVGVAVAPGPLGPYRKAPEPLLRSTPQWWGPGHPSVAPGPDGRPHLFLHAFRPGRMGYKAFRALLSTPLRLEPDGVRLG